MTNLHIIRRNTFIVGALIQLILLLYAVFFNQKFIMDGIFSLVAIGLFYIIEQRYPLNPIIIFFGFIPLYFHNVGVLFGFFGLKIFGLGYDKWAHFINSSIVTIVLFYILIAHSKERIIKHILIAFLIMLGFNLLHEVNEFIGTRYLGIYSESLFSVGDALAPSGSDLQVYDAWWDMIFDIFGGLFAMIFLLITRLLENTHERDYFRNS
ncbi:MAG: hypothetical protein KatS3mg002_0705 [Candidatus Woesearchaeota archaeon]|nr:MAG: hypothetical protein KatS3mg002_0705 [Candidatus Woesearchaeota archaeon]